MKHHSSRRPYLNRLNSEINVVPYIDVMLVLLVIFMITAPLLSQGVKVNLPQASSQKLSTKQQPLIISVDQKGRYFLNMAKQPGTALSANQLMSKINYILMHKKSSVNGVYVKGDRAVNYGKVVQAMVLLQKAGAHDVGLITRNPT